MVDEGYLAIVISGRCGCGLLIPSFRWVASTEVLIPPPCFTCQKGCITRSKRGKGMKQKGRTVVVTQQHKLTELFVCYLMFVIYCFYFSSWCRCCSSSLLFLVFLLLRFVLVPASGAGVVGGGSHGLLVAAVVCAIVGGGGSQEVPLCF